MLAPVLTKKPENMPVTLEDARKHLDVYGFNDDDNQITSLIEAAVSNLEKTLDYGIVTQNWSQSFCGFTGVTLLQKRPVKSIISVKYYDAENQIQVLDPTKYWLLNYVWGSVLKTDPSASIPAVYSREDAVTVEYSIGSDQQDVDQSLKSAVLLHVRALYEFRSDLSALKIESIGAYEGLIWPYRRPKV